MSAEVPVDAAFLRGFADRWVTAWNSRTTDEVLALLHPDVVWDEQVYWPGVLHGREAVRAYVEDMWRVMPAYTLTERQLFTAPEAGRALLFFDQHGHGPAGLAADRTFTIQACDIFLEFRDGLLAHYTGCFEIADMLRQLGALPERGGRKGGAYLLSLTSDDRATTGARHD